MDTKVFDHLQNPILLVSKTGNIKYFNFVCSLFFKLPPRKLTILKSINELIQVSAFSVMSEVEKCLASSAPVVSPEIEILIGDKAISVILKFIPIGTEDVLIHIQDFSIEKQLHEKYKQQIIELKSTHEQIVKSDKLTALGELIAGISHEISSPLTVAADTILAISENLHHKNFNEMKNDLNDLDIEFTRIRQIVSNMQSMAKNKEDEVTVISLKETVQKSIDFVKDLNGFGDIEISCNCLPSFILGNDSKIQQVLINMLKNSADAVSIMDKKQIKIAIEEQDQCIQIHIIDNGSGIKDKDKIFDMFYTTKEFGEGTGLGLAISQKIVQAYHGTLSVIDSKKGAHLCIEFPNLDLESFTSTNRYLTGECEIEDPKVLVFSHKLEDLKFIYDKFSNEKIILILTNNQSGFEENCESYMVDYAVSFSQDVKTDDYNYLNFEGKDTTDICEILEEVING